MAKDDKTSSSPLANLITEAREGRLTVRMDLEKFVYLDRDCDYFKDQIRDIQTTMTRIHNQDTWGLGEHFPKEGDRDLISAKTMVSRWREKSQGSDNSVFAVMESHYKVIEDFQTLFRTVRERITSADSAQATRYQDLETNLPKQPPAQAKIFSWPGL
ncbi:hypothetical protein [Nocardia sp. NBC_01009]|uniref:hypothetical protein n=1 Tax=Nocardia sp. NBC_01009 TaxID=2975996 RepID=UPI003867A127|nr:hypothetical protein OHA42_38095 [Nocardia sp. NBC_01009]